MDANVIEHDERCVWDHVLYGNCFHTEDGQRLEPEEWPVLPAHNNQKPT